jgi:hypothetical protein
LGGFVTKPVMLFNRNQARCSECTATASTAPIPKRVASMAEPP